MTNLAINLKEALRRRSRVLMGQAVRQSSLARRWLFVSGGVEATALPVTTPVTPVLYGWCGYADQHQAGPWDGAATVQVSPCW